MDKTIEYYEKNAGEFVESTVSVDFQKMQDRFLEKLEEGAMILDLGCGSGRDTRYFLQKGYQTEAADGSRELCRKASRYTGIQVKHMLFQELDEQEKYNGVWACSSILHLPKKELADVMKRIRRALKTQGILYTSFKYGSFEGYRNGRYFTDFTEESFSLFLQDIQGFVIEEIWTTKDVRPGRSGEQWLNMILRKTEK